MAFKLKVVAEAEAVENNSETAQDYGFKVLLYVNSSTNFDKSTQIGCAVN